MTDLYEPLDFTAKGYETPLTKEEALICETLVREIGRAGRWSAVLEGFNALLHVRHMAASMHIEAGLFESHDQAKTKDTDKDKDKDKAT